MSAYRIAVRYAKSLFDIAQAEGVLEQVHQDLLMFGKVCRQRDFAALLRSPIVKADKKNAILDAVFGNHIQKVTRLFLRLLVNKGREAQLPEIADAFVDLYRQHKSITPVQITTAVPLSESALQAIVAKLEQSSLTNNTIELETKVDPDLIGGFVLKFDHRQYDASVRHQLELLEASFSENTYSRQY